MRSFFCSMTWRLSTVYIAQHKDSSIVAVTGTLGRSRMFQQLHKKENVLDTRQTRQEMAAGIPRNRFLPGTSTNNAITRSQKAPAPAVSRLRAELNTSSPTSKAKDHGTKASKSRSVSKSPKRTQRKRSSSKPKAEKMESSANCSEVISVSERKLAFTSRPMKETRHGHVLPTTDKGKSTFVSKPTKKEDTRGKESCMMDAMKFPKLRNDLKHKTSLPSVGELPLISKPVRKEDDHGKRVCPLNGIKPLNVCEQIPRHVPCPPSVSKGKVPHVAKPTIKGVTEIKACLRKNSVNPSNLNEDAPAPVVSRLSAELKPSGPTSKTEDRGTKASKSRSVSKSPKRKRSRSKTAKKKESSASCSDAIDVPERKIGPASSPKKESMHEHVLSAANKGKSSFASTPTKKEDARGKEFCTTDAVNYPNLKNDLRHKPFLPSVAEGELPLISKPDRKEDAPGKKVCPLNAIKPLNLNGEISKLVPCPPSVGKGKISHVAESKIEEEVTEEKVCVKKHLIPLNLNGEKTKFFKSNFKYDPQFKYKKPVPPGIPTRHSKASDKFLQLATEIINNTLEKYGSYEKFEEAAGGRPLKQSQISKEVEKYIAKEGCKGKMSVRITEDKLSIASMATVNGKGRLTINLSTAREKWLEGTLRHEIGTHYHRSINHRRQLWSKNRETYRLQPANPTEEGFATINTVLLYDEPYLCKIALLYYAVYKASSMSFSELFRHLSTYVKDPDTLWYYCMRAKRGLTDTSRPGCYSKDQVYLTGVLQILRHRQTIDFQLLMSMGKISFEDIDRLKPAAVTKKARIPHFMKDISQYRKHLDHIMNVNGITDGVLTKLIE